MALELECDELKRLLTLERELRQRDSQTAAAQMEDLKTKHEQQCEALATRLEKQVCTLESLVNDKMKLQDRVQALVAQVKSQGEE